MDCCIGVINPGKTPTTEPRFFGIETFFQYYIKLRLGALIPWSVGLSVGVSVGLSVGPPKITKKLQNFTKHYKTLQNITNC